MNRKQMSVNDIFSTDSTPASWFVARAKGSSNKMHLGLRRSAVSSLHPKVREALHSQSMQQTVCCTVRSMPETDFPACDSRPQKPCEWSCQHHRCRSRCSAPCGKGPCDQPCQKKLACGHACAGLCGDPCPPLCPVCHRKELREAFLGRPWDGGRARFVLLEDCGHTVDSKTMEKHIGKYKGEIGFVACPRCGHPIFHLRRFKHSIQEANERVKQVFYIYFISTPSIELKGWNLFKAEIVMTTPKCKKASSKLQRWAKQAENYSLVEFIDFLLHGAARFLKTWRMVKTRSPSPSVPALEAKAMTFLFAMLQRVLSPSSGAITHQLVEEVQWELRRLENYLCYTGVREVKGTSALSELSRLIDPRVKFSEETQLRVREFMKNEGKAEVHEAFSTWERFQPRMKQGLSRGRQAVCVSLGSAVMESDPAREMRSRQLRPPDAWVEDGGVAWDDGCMGAKERWKGYNINHRKVSAAVDEEGGSRGRKRRQ
ncbi:putative NFX1-type zinc finger-containing protein 1-like isoform X1 [Penaeus vannamei]|uniref:Putative NFX1-type zinc finger-containing protein 1-like isoform X1 n=1 Tax=Penaeus vannamei TaxID=6689 RepID=A0A3R7PYA9_PENVA|nr:putative NFX1-type zinc finger-containing protein 1-like isoform X1 [Penaeus vannamei]